MLDARSRRRFTRWTVIHGGRRCRRFPSAIMKFFLIVRTMAPAVSCLVCLNCSGHMWNINSQTILCNELEHFLSNYCLYPKQSLATETFFSTMQLNMFWILPPVYNICFTFSFRPSILIWIGLVSEQISSTFTSILLNFFDCLLVFMEVFYRTHLKSEERWSLDLSLLRLVEVEVQIENPQR